MLHRRSVLKAFGAMPMAWLAGVSVTSAAAPILTLRGGFAKAGADGSVACDLASLDALPQTAFETTTPWHKGAVRFSGVSLKDYLAAFGAIPTTIRLVALNDYVVDADVAELLAGEALLATRQDGETMPVSDKGPVFLVFPFDSRSELQHQTYYSRAVWQLTEIDIVA